MSKAIIGKHSLAEMTDSRTAEFSPASSDEPLEAPPDESDPERKSLRELAVELQNSFISRRIRSADDSSKRAVTKHRQGLPDGFVSRLRRFGRSVLLEDNVYRLTDGHEFIPQHPSGILGGRSHQYALLTLEQYEKGKRGSIFIRTDGRIFDYSFDHGDPAREIFDTGFTIHDLERTGRYAPQLGLRVRIVNIEKKPKRRGGAGRK